MKRQSSIFKRLKRSWDRFNKAPPGQRFQQQFSRRQQSGHGPIQKALLTTAGILLMAAGSFFLFVPGPGLPILFLGAILIARQSLLAARTLDSAEVRARKLLSWSWGLWRSFSPAVKTALAVLALAAAGAVGFGAFRLFV